MIVFSPELVRPICVCLYFYARTNGANAATLRKHFACDRIIGIDSLGSRTVFPATRSINHRSSGANPVRSRLPRQLGCLPYQRGHQEVQINGHQHLVFDTCNSTSRFQPASTIYRGKRSITQNDRRHASLIESTIRRLVPQLPHHCQTMTSQGARRPSSASAIRDDLEITSICMQPCKLGKRLTG
ncbi:MAG: hypothetical protein JWP89_1194 [Schlesneria sp.]|nr:hypothetical protein [Schlesneria sp.]